jgi:hypothetical protein
MRKTTSLAYVGLLAAAALAPGCGGDQTTASKSAAAFDEAQRKGAVPSGGEAHGQHGAAEEAKAGSATGQGGAAAPHTGHDTQGGLQAPGKAPDMAGMDHSRKRGMRETAGAGTRAAPGMDHANMPGMAGAQASRPGTGGARAQPHAGHTTTPMAGIDHANMPGMAGTQAAPPGTGSARPQPHAGHANAPTAGTDHSNMPGMDHSRMAQRTGGAAPPVPDRPAATASPEQLVATLRPDPLDVPEPTAIREAARAAEIAQQMAGGHGMAHGTYRQIDAGREDVTPTPSGHEGHQMTPAPPPPSSADPHAGHSAPTTAPAQAAPAPSADPHAGHAKPAAPRPNPTPSPRPTPTPRPKQDNR